jgi:hypothetical protein
MKNFTYAEISSHVLKNESRYCNFAQRWPAFDEIRFYAKYGHIVIKPLASLDFISIRSFSTIIKIRVLLFCKTILIKPA